MANQFDALDDEIYQRYVGGGQPAQEYDAVDQEIFDRYALGINATPEPAKQPGFFQSIGTSALGSAGSGIAGVGTALEDVGLPSLGTPVRTYGEGIQQANPSSISQFSDILDKPKQFAGEALGQVGSSILATGGGSLIGRGLGTAIGAALPIPGAAPALGALGGLAGGFASNLAGEYGETRANQREMGFNDPAKALGAALPAAALDYAADRYVGKIGKLGQLDAVPAGMGRPAFMAQEALKGALIEGPITEVPQTVLERWGGGKDLASNEALNEYGIAGAMGALGGGVVSGGLGGLAPNAPADQTDQQTEQPPLGWQKPDFTITPNGWEKPGFTINPNEPVQTEAAPIDVPPTSPVGMTQAEADAINPDPIQSAGLGWQKPAFQINPTQPVLGDLGATDESTQTPVTPGADRVGATGPEAAAATPSPTTDANARTDGADGLYSTNTLGTGLATDPAPAGRDAGKAPGGAQGQSDSGLLDAGQGAVKPVAGATNETNLAPETAPDTQTQDAGLVDAKVDEAKQPLTGTFPTPDVIRSRLKEDPGYQYTQKKDGKEAADAWLDNAVDNSVRNALRITETSDRMTEEQRAEGRAIYGSYLESRAKQAEQPTNQADATSGLGDQNETNLATEKAPAPPQDTGLVDAKVEPADKAITKPNSLLDQIENPESRLAPNPLGEGSYVQPRSQYASILRRDLERGLEDAQQEQDFFSRMSDSKENRQAQEAASSKITDIQSKLSELDAIAPELKKRDDNDTNVATTDFMNRSGMRDARSVIEQLVADGRMPEDQARRLIEQASASGNFDDAQRIFDRGIESATADATSELGDQQVIAATPSGDTNEGQEEQRRQGQEGLLTETGADVKTEAPKQPWVEAADRGEKWNESRWFQSRVRVAPGMEGDKAKEGIVTSVYQTSDGPLVMVQPDGWNDTIKVRPDRISVLSVKDSEQETAEQPAPTGAEQTAQPEKPKPGQYQPLYGPQGATRDGQIAMAQRAGRTSMLGQLNDAVAQTNPDAAYTQDEILNAADDRIDSMRDWLISQQSTEQTNAAPTPRDTGTDADGLSGGNPPTATGELGATGTTGLAGRGNQRDGAGGLGTEPGLTGGRDSVDSVTRPALAPQLTETDKDNRFRLTNVADLGGTDAVRARLRDAGINIPGNAIDDNTLQFNATQRDKILSALTPTNDEPQQLPGQSQAGQEGQAQAQAETQAQVASTAQQAPQTREAAIRTAVDSVQNRTIGSWHPVTVEHGGVPAQFMTNVKRVYKDGKKPSPVSIQQIRTGKLLAGDQPQPLVYSYRLTRDNQLVEEGVPRPASEAELSRWQKAFPDQPAQSPTQIAPDIAQSAPNSEGIAQSNVTRTLERTLPWQQSLDEFANQQVEQSNYAETYRKQPKLAENFKAQQTDKWIEALKQRATEGRIDDAALDDFVERYGVQGLHSTFRGQYERGIEGYMPKDVRAETVESRPVAPMDKPAHEQTWAEYRKYHTPDGFPDNSPKTPAYWKALKQQHRTVLSRNSEKVPEAVRADYPDLFKPAEAVAPTETAAQPTLNVSQRGQFNGANAVRKAMGKPALTEAEWLAEQSGTAAADVQTDDGMQDWEGRWAELRQSGDKPAIREFFDKVRVMLNGPAQKNGKVAQFEKLKADIETYAAATTQPVAEKKENVAEKPVAFDPEDIGGAPSEAPMSRARRKKILTGQIRHDGQVKTKQQFVQDLLASGETLRTDEENRIKEPSRLRWFRMNNAEQRAHERKVKEGGKITTYWLGDYQINKTEYDYATYLQSKQQKGAESNAESQANEATSPVTGEAVTGGDAVTGEVPQNLSEKLKANAAPATAPNPNGSVYDDPRMKRPVYRDTLRSYKTDIVKGGDVAYLKDEHGRITGRTQSVNPQWFQNLPDDTKMSVERAQAAIEKAATGKKLGVRENRLILALLDETQSQRSEPRVVDYARSQLEAQRERKRKERADAAVVRQALGLDATESVNLGYEHLEEDYEAEDSHETRMIADLAEQYRALPDADENRLDSLLEKDIPDAEIAKQLQEQINGRTRQGSTQADTEMAGEAADQADAFGGLAAVDRRTREISDRLAVEEAQREVAKRLNATQAPPADEGLFAEEDRQNDIFDEPVAETKPAETTRTEPKAEAKPEAEQAKPESTTPRLDAYDAFWERIRNGEVTAAELKAEYASYLEAKAEIAAELNQQTLKQLAPYGTRGRTKAEIISDIVRSMGDRFSLDKPISYVFGSPNAYANAQRDAVESITDADLETFAKEVAESRAEAAQKREQAKAAIANPQTLDDYRTYVRAKMADGSTQTQAFQSLTPEQRAQYDELSAAESRDKRQARADQQKTSVTVAASTTSGEVVETRHTKTGEPLFVVKAAERVDREVYNEWNSTAKRMGGYYSSYRGGGAVPGFQFKTRENAEAFLAYLGGDTEQAQSAIQTRRDAFADDKSQSAVERLTDMADRLEERADDTLNADRKVNTARRARMASGIEARANADKAMAKTMRNIAKAIESGKVQFLDRVRQKVQVEMLDRLTSRAQSQELLEQYPSYADRERQQGKPPTTATIDYAEYPQFTAYRSDLATLGRALLEQEGTKKLGASILKVADDVTAAYQKFIKENLQKVSVFTKQDGSPAIFTSRDDADNAIRRSGYRGKAMVFAIKRGQNMIVMGPQMARERGIWEGDPDKRITLSGELGAEIVAKANRRDVRIPGTFEGVAADRARLQAMGIETGPELRAALREYVGLKQAPAEKDAIKEMERSMIGRANDGLDFFPTSPEVVDDMIAAAEIQPGMAVLEPSAGMGHIADRIREADVEPDVVEMSSSRRELLQAKGFNLVGNDFMDIKEGEYDRILMNPPFSKRRDAEHVRHAFDLLKPGGRVVAIMGEGVFFGQDQKAQDFREWLDSVGGTSEKLPEGTFMDPSLPVNTGVNARMVVIDKPGEPARFRRDAAQSVPAQQKVRPVLSRDAVESAVTGIRRKLGLNLGVRIRTVGTEAELPADILAQAKKEGATGQVIAVHRGNEIFLVADRHTSLAQVEESILHESNHYGANALFGKAKEAAYSRLYFKLGKEAGIRELANRMGVDLTGYLNTANDMRKAGQVTKEQRYSYLVDELLANIQGKKAYASLPQKIKTAIQEFYGAIRNWLNQRGFVNLAKFNDADLAYLLRSIHRAAQGNVATGRGKAMFMVAWHGGPHDFDKFSTSKIGTGEGNQAFGRGLYFSSVRDIANHYREKLSHGLSGGTSLAGVMPSSTDKGLTDDAWGAAKDLSQLLISNTGVIQPFSSLDIVKQGRMLSMMRRILEDSKVLQSVVRLVPIDVVNMLGSKQLSSNMLLDNPSMLIDLLPVDADNLVPASVKALDILVPSVALSAAKIHSGLTRFDVSSNDLSTASRASNHNKSLLDKLYSKIPYPNEFNKGRLYQVELAPAEDEYLDWHKPLSEQIEQLRRKGINPAEVVEADEEQIKRLEELLRNVKANAGYVVKKQLGNDPTGEQIYKALQSPSVPKALGLPAWADKGKSASKYLHSLGIRGIRYPAEGQTGGKTGDKMNYVIFSEDDVSITAKFNRAPTILVDGQERPTTNSNGLFGRTLSGVVLARKSAMSESRPNSSASDAKTATDLLISPAFSLEGLGGLDAPSQRKVLDAVVLLSEYPQILNSVIELIPIDVMDYLSREQLSPDVVLGNKSMLKELLSVNSDGSVASAVDVADSLIAAVTSVAAKFSGGFNNVLAESQEGFPAAIANQWDLSVSSWHNSNLPQIKPTGNTGAFSDSTDIRFSRAYTPEQQAVIDKFAAGQTMQQKPWGERIREATDRWQTAWAQKVVDRYRSFRDILNNPELWMQARLASQSEGAVHASLHFGAPKFDVAMQAIETDLSAKPLEKINEDLGGEINDFFKWVAGQRAQLINRKSDRAKALADALQNDLKKQQAEIERLSQGPANNAERIAELRQAMLETNREMKAARKAASIRERFLDEDTIEASLTFADGKMADGRDRKAVYQQAMADFNKLNDAFVDMNVQAGTISAEDAERWRSEGVYVPFYRFLQDDAGEPNRRGLRDLASLDKQTAFKQFKGSAIPLNDLLSNVLANWHHLSHTATHNLVATKALEQATEMGLAEPIPESQADDKSLWIRQDGQKQFYRMTGGKDAELVWESLQGMHYTGLNNNLMKVAQTFTGLLRAGVTANPAYRLRNLIRDTFQAQATSNVPFAAVIKGWKQTGPKTIEEIQQYANMLSSGGMFGIHEAGYLREGNPGSANAKAMLKLGAKPDKDGALLLTKDALSKLWDKYQAGGARLENVNRAAAFTKTLDETGSLLKAAFEANDLMPFQMRGTSHVLFNLARIVPFFNSRLQGLDKLARSASDPATRKQFWAVTGTYMAMSLLAYLALKDDDDYEALEEWKKDSYHYFKIDGQLYKLPRPFEMGVMASMLERTAEQVFKDVPASLWVERLYFALSNTFAISVIPQAVQPMLDVYANRDSFSGRPIETLGMENRSKTQRKTPDSSYIGVGISEGLDAVVDALTFGRQSTPLSPVQVDSMIEGYLGWLGSFGMAASNMILDGLTGAPDKPADIRRMPIVGDIINTISETDEPRSTKYSSAFYDHLRVVREAQADFSQARKLGDTKQMAEIRVDKATELKAKDAYNKAANTISDINATMQRIRAGNDSGEAKKRKLDELARRKNMIAKTIESRYGRALD